MILRQFYINLVIRIISILLNMIVLAIIARDLFQNQLMFTFVVIAFVLVLQVVLLFNYIKKTNKLFTKFILTISNMDFVSKFGEDYTQTPHKGLNKAFNKILEQYHGISREKQKQYFLTQHIIETIPVGILVFNEYDKVSFKNKLGEELLGIEEVYSLGQINDEVKEFGVKLKEIRNSENFMLESYIGKENKKLAISVKTINLFNQKQKLISIQDVRKEFDAGELDAIQRLMRILTHEIMNSLTPINSLTETVIMLMSDEKGHEKPFKEFSDKNYSDVRESILAIKERGEGLDHFVNNFRTLTRLPEKLKKETVFVKDLFSSVCTIMKVETTDVVIQTDVNDKELDIAADQALIEQVIINLVKNSITAVVGKENPLIKLKSFKKEDNTIIQVIDNGIGIPKNKINDIFIPFYTTKEKGSGIGLSFARQIMNLHNGVITVQSKDQETIFTLKF